MRSVSAVTLVEILSQKSMAQPALFGSKAVCGISSVLRRSTSRPSSIQPTSLCLNFEMSKLFHPSQHNPKGQASLRPVRPPCTPRHPGSPDLILPPIRQSIPCQHPLEPAPAFRHLRLGSVPPQFAQVARCQSPPWSEVSFLGLQPPNGMPPAWSVAGRSIAGESAPLGRFGMRSKDPDAERSLTRQPRATFQWECCGVGIVGM